MDYGCGVITCSKCFPEEYYARKEKKRAEEFDAFYNNLFVPAMIRWSHEKAQQEHDQPD